MKPCVHLDYDPHYSGCELCTAAPHFPDVRYWKRLNPPYEGAPVKVQFCKLRGRINDIFSCYNGEMSCYQPEVAPQNNAEAGEQQATTVCQNVNDKG